MSDATTTAIGASRAQPDEVAERLQRVLLRLWAGQRQCEANEGSGAVTALQLGYLSALSALGPTRASHLAEALGVTPAATSVAVQRLTRAGLVVRSSRASDQREVHIAITQHGREEYELSISKRENTTRVALSQLSMQDCEALRRALPILRDIFSSTHVQPSTDARRPTPRSPTNGRRGRNL
ncbi:MarR family winged helix-turn-helix transcriptional regulator [Mycobacterium sp. GA-1841]|uniref:MarR family winged helix-turn-helix transcriptional regulator n=1 Tax=Mycobacterium sp. GA-1841 TaxID=1834154 RepID=UPI00096EB958